MLAKARVKLPMLKDLAPGEARVFYVPASATGSMIAKAMKSIRRALRVAARFSYDLLTNPF